jgi:tripartite-type tricarboxylate transporter receptor subunit TctC
MAGQTQAMFPSLAGALPHIRSGRMRPLAVTGKSRHELLKDVPTFEELGFKGFDGEQWYGIMGPAGLPAAIVRLLNEALATVLAQPDFKDKLSAEAVALRPVLARTASHLLTIPRCKVEMIWLLPPPVLQGLQSR